MKSNIKSIKASVLVAVGAVAIFAGIFTTSSTWAKQRGLSNSDALMFSQNDITNWDPGECEDDPTSTGMCGDTPKEKYWSYLRQTFDEIHAAAILGNIDNEGGYGPTRWEIGKVVSRDGGPFIMSWDSLYSCQPCNVGVGAVGITWNLGNYLHYINDNLPDALPFFKDAQYSWPGDKALEKMGSADFDKVVEAEMSWVLEESKGIHEAFNKITDVKEAAKYWAENYEKCEGCLASQGMTETKKKRMEDAAYEYDALKDFVCQNGSGNVYKAGTFSLTDGQLYGMVHMAKHEQDSVEGIKFELSLMANKADKDNRSDIADYIRNSSWFASGTRSSYSESRGSLSDAEISAGRDVLENGNRVIPPQIVEHDCIGDLEWIELDGVKHYGSNPGGCKGTGLFKSEYYVSGKTKIHNTYGSTYIFYTFPKAGDINSGDPFGYFENDPPSGSSGTSGASSSSSSSSDSSSSSSEPVSGNNITWIGDSYSTGAQKIIEEKFSGISFGGTVNTDKSTIQACKFVSADTTCNANPTNPSGFKVLEDVISKGDLKQYLVFALGTNGGWTDADITKFKEIIKDQNVKVILVNSRTPNEDFSASNERLKNLASGNDNIFLADWVSVYDATYFTGDPEKIHPVSSGGYEKWVSVISDALSSAGGGCTSYGDKYPQYFQGDYENSDHENADHDWTQDTYNGGTFGGNACGPTSMAMLATVATGQDIYPYDTAAFGNWVNTSLTELDPKVGEKYGFEVIAESYSSKPDAYDKIKKYLEDGYMIHLSGEGCHDGFATPYASGGCTDGHYIGIFSISDGDKVWVANSAYMGNSEVDLQSIIDAIHNGVFTAIKGSGNKNSCNSNKCDNGGKGQVNGGLSESQAEKLRDYYNSDAVSASDWGLPFGKKNCVSFSMWFVQALTSIGKNSAISDNGNGVAHNTAKVGNLEEGTEPRPYSVFSVTDGITICEDGNKCGHTGIVVGVDGDDILTVEAAYPDTLAYVSHRSKSYFVNTKYTNSFTYLDSILDKSALAEIVGN